MVVCIVLFISYSIQIVVIEFEFLYSLVFTRFFNPTTNSETMNLNFQFQRFSQNKQQFNWWRNPPKFKIRSFGICCLLRWARFWKVKIITKCVEHCFSIVACNNNKVFLCGMCFLQQSWFIKFNDVWHLMGRKLSWHTSKHTVISTISKLWPILMNFVGKQYNAL